MSTIYRDTVDSTASLYLPNAPTLTVDVIRDGVVLSSGLPTVVDAGLHEVVLPFVTTQYDADLTLQWKTAGQVQRVTREKVITPIVPISYIFKVATDNGQTYDSDKLGRIESQVRSMVEAYTGQFFGLYLGTKEVKGTGDPFLALPLPLLEPGTIDHNGLALTDITGLRTTPDGWYLVRPRHYLEIKEAPPEEITYGVIYAPPRNGLGFYAGSYYGITGKWGYYNVPEAVFRAAELLVTDFMCNEVAYRDAYVTAVTSADWRADFNENKFRGTGNSRADVLLDPYKNINMVVI